MIQAAIVIVSVLFGMVLMVAIIQAKRRRTDAALMGVINEMESFAATMEQRLSKASNNPYPEGSIQALVWEHLALAGCDGLCNPEIRCCCSVDNLMPCGTPHMRKCVVAVKLVDGNCRSDGDNMCGG